MLWMFKNWWNLAKNLHSYLELIADAQLVNDNTWKKQPTVTLLEQKMKLNGEKSKEGEEDQIDIQYQSRSEMGANILTESPSGSNY